MSQKRCLSSMEDAKLNDKFRDLSTTNTRLFRVTRKTFENTGTYTICKIFKPNERKDFMTHQILSLNATEVEAFTEYLIKLRSMKKQAEDKVKTDALTSQLAMDEDTQF